MARPAPASGDDSDDMAVTMTHKVSPSIPQIPSSAFKQKREKERKEGRGTKADLLFLLLSFRSCRVKRTPLLLLLRQSQALLNKLNGRSSLSWIERQRIR